MALPGGWSSCVAVWVGWPEMLEVEHRLGTVREVVEKSRLVCALSQMQQRDTDTSSVWAEWLFGIVWDRGEL